MSNHLREHKLFDKNVAKRIVTDVEKRLGGKLNKEELRQLGFFIKRNHNSEDNKCLEFPVLVKKVARDFYDAICFQRKPEPYIDVKEMLKHDIICHDQEVDRAANCTPLPFSGGAAPYIFDAFSNRERGTYRDTSAYSDSGLQAEYENTYGKKKVKEDFTTNTLIGGSVPAVSGVQTISQTLFLDSRIRDKGQSDLSNGKLSWNVVKTENNSETGTIGTNNHLSSITAIQIGDIQMPYSRIIYNTIRKASMYIEQLGSQSTNLGPNRHTFMFNVQLSSLNGNEYDASGQTNKVILTPINSVYRFNTPFTSIDRLTCVFRNPDLPIPFNDENIMVSMTYGNPTVFTSQELLGLINGDEVIISGVSGSGKDELFNNPYGHIVQVINNYNFSINIDTSSLSGTQEVSAYLSQRRIFIPITFFLSRRLGDYSL